MSQLSVQVVDPNSPDATELLATLDEYQSGLYPPASTHLLPATELARPGAVFLGAFLGGKDGRVLRVRPLRRIRGA